MKESKNTVTHEQIAKRAFEIYLSRGNKPGSAMEDWMKAEAELKGLVVKSTTAQTSVRTTARPIPARTSAIKNNFKGNTQSLR